MMNYQYTFVHYLKTIKIHRYKFELIGRRYNFFLLMIKYSQLCRVRIKNKGYVHYTSICCLTINLIVLSIRIITFSLCM